MDLLVQTAAQATLHRRARITMKCEQALKSPIDIVTLQRGTPGSAFSRINRSREQPLKNAA